VPKEVVVISGKGGTGKTSVVAAFAALAENMVMTDCDVDAADLHLILQPQPNETHAYSGGKKARIQPELCAACGKCAELCRFGAVTLTGPANDSVKKTYVVDPISCEGCAVCVRYCPTEAILFETSDDGEWFVSDTRYGPMVHAKLRAGRGTSGILVSAVRKKAQEIAKEGNYDLIISDGSPGIGCPVIASLAGADLALAVTEPTLSGLHDLKRVAELAGHFEIPVAVVVNKFDLSQELTEQVEQWAESTGARVVGRIPYDPVVTEAQMAGQSVVEFGDGNVAEELVSIWGRVCELLK